MRRTRDTAAFERALAPHQQALRASALRLTRNRADADDLVQEALLRAFRFWDRYREEDCCRAWLQRILVNTFYSERRTRTRQRTLLDAYAQARKVAEAVSGEPELTAPISQEELQDSLGALRPEQRHILRLVDMHEHTYREAADSLACPIGTVMSRLHRARAALRTQLTQKAQRACA
jgi:RNA polymerase sigma-70 factor (ECF subfamily)